MMMMMKKKKKMSDEENKNDDAKTWGTWEELLLASAVKRHGLKNWDSVAMELQTKTSLPHLLTTAQCCKQKYHDLKRRFKDEHEHEPPAKLVNIPWLEELRKVRVDELKQEVQRYDLNILSLQLKVKRLEEEREPALDIKTTQQKPDPDDRNIVKEDEPEKSEEPEKVCKRLVSGEESDRENRSVNESNSTGLSEKIGDGEMTKNEAKVVGSGGVGGGGESKAVESDELGDSVTQLSSDVQSSASFGKKRKRSCGDSIKGMDVKSEPLMRLLELIRTHKHVSSFERRLKSQESINYKEIVRQHVDLETIQTRVEQGSYSSCILTFYRDVLLLFNNAIVYFPKSSIESATAFQLRNLFSNEIKKENHKSDSSQDPLPPPAPAPVPAPLPPQLKPHLERSDSLLAKHKQSAPIIVCRKRSSVSTKPSTSSSTFARQQQQTDDKKPPPADIKPSVERSSSLLKVQTEEKAVTTGARSSRRSNRNPTTNSTTNTSTPPSSNKKQNSTSGSKAGSGSVDKQETPKAEKKKSEGSTTSDKKKSVVDFLKRIKKNSPVQTVKKSRGSEEQKKNNNNNSSSSSSSSSGKKDKGKERALWRSGEKRQSAKEESSPSKRSVGRPPKKTAETSGKRGREGGGKETVVGKRQSKRARR